MPQNQQSKKVAKLLAPLVQQASCMYCKHWLSSPFSCECGVTSCAACRSRSCARCGLSDAHHNEPANERVRRVCNLLTEFQKHFHYDVKKILDEQKNAVQNWLEDTQNQFSAQIFNSELSENTDISENLPIVLLNKCDSYALKKGEATKTAQISIHVPPPQHDWDKIEVLPCTEEVDPKPSEEVVDAVMDIQLEDGPELVVQTRRSSRNRVPNKGNIYENPSKKVKVTEKNIDKNKKMQKAKMDRNTAKRKWKEINKLKSSKSKLNVSIEMSKKSRSAASKTDVTVPSVISLDSPYIIQEETPVVAAHMDIENNINAGNLISETAFVENIENLGAIISNSTKIDDIPKEIDHNIENMTLQEPESLGREASQGQSAPKTPFMKIITSQQQEHIASNEIGADDILITIKTNESVINININKKKLVVVTTEDTQDDVLRVPNSDGETNSRKKHMVDKQIQTSHDGNCIGSTSNNLQVDNIDEQFKPSNRNVLSSQKAESLTDKQSTPTTSRQKIVNILSNKKNTESADTKTAPCEPAASNEKYVTTTSVVTRTQNNSSQSVDNNNEQSKIQSNPKVNVLEEDDFIEDFDIFDSPVVEGDQANNGPAESATFAGTKTHILRSNTQNSSKKTHSEHFNVCSQIMKPSHTMKSTLSNQDEDMHNSENMDCDEDIVELSRESVINLEEVQSANSDREKLEVVGKFSENVFLTADKDSEPVHIVDEPLEHMQSNSDEGDSDSVVEETPQKKKRLSRKRKRSAEHSLDTEDVNDLVEVTEAAAADHKQSMQTPLNIKGFVANIIHNSTKTSTPAAKKSLSFTAAEPEHSGDITLCANVSDTTQEKEFMKKVFEATPVTKSPVRASKSYCFAGSCLSVSEQKILCALCVSRGWQYSVAYTAALTHLVVSVDEENKAQRSVKYMLALAGGCWIVSTRWLAYAQKNASLQPKQEREFEVLDWSGSPGPQRSRLAPTKLFDGFTFHCLPPYSVLNAEDLAKMLVLAGGRVVDSPKELVRVGGKSPALLLVEPENTQKSCYMFMAMELGVVPVNTEWVLNCLGNYKIESLGDSLLCPEELLPAVVKDWPSPLLK